MKIVCFVILCMFTTGMLTGCCKSNSLVKYKMSDDQIDRLIRKEFDGFVSLEDRFHTAASMTDWRNRWEIMWNGYPIVPWNSNKHEMAIPLAICFYGGTYAWEEVVIQFDDE